MSRKILTGLLLAGLLVPVFAMAIPAVPDSCKIRADVSEYLADCPAGDNVECSYDAEDSPCALCCLMGTVLYSSDIIFIVLIVLVIFFVFMGAWKILTAGGNPDNVNAGRDFIMFAAIGLGVAILAKAVPNLVSFFIGGGSI